MSMDGNGGDISIIISSDLFIKTKINYNLSAEMLVLKKKNSLPVNLDYAPVWVKKDLSSYLNLSIERDLTNKIDREIILQKCSLFIIKQKIKSCLILESATCDSLRWVCDLGHLGHKAVPGGFNPPPIIPPPPEINFQLRPCNRTSWFWTPITLGLAQACRIYVLIKDDTFNNYMYLRLGIFLKTTVSITKVELRYHYQIHQITLYWSQPILLHHAFKLGLNSST
ncbi:hypothetical protein AGLY_005528 [Aphis glycines]|uniref:Uncharacterized protein n=1 Tax=Aphis glycines TaxID=307491 RepID=A0A6G0TVJ2_APHGL|nr:hypothetical protein AGLY_005528 [Aphis glycines]